MPEPPVARADEDPPFWLSPYPFREPDWPPDDDE